MDVLILYIKAGGGHIASAKALEEASHQTHPDWNVTCIDLRELLDKVDPIKSWLGIEAENVYNSLLRYGYIRGMKYWIKLQHGLIKALHQPMVKQLTKYLNEHHYDMVVSVIPHFNDAIAESISATKEFLVVMTDMADYPPDFWMAQDNRYYLVCGTKHAYDQAVQAHWPDHLLFRTNGLVVHPDFYSSPYKNTHHDKTPMGLITFGGYPSSSDVLNVVTSIHFSKIKTSLIIVGGHNGDELHRIIFNQHWIKVPYLVTNYIKMSDEMCLVDYVVGKPGPGVINEAMMSGLPIITARERVMPQEKYNLTWIEENHVGVVVDTYNQIGVGVRKVLDNYEFYKKNVAKIGSVNNAVFQITDIIEALYNLKIEEQRRYL